LRHLKTVNGLSANLKKIRDPSWCLAFIQQQKNLGTLRKVLGQGISSAPTFEFQLIVYSQIAQRSRFGDKGNP
jgi:hypothetical protein